MNILKILKIAGKVIAAAPIVIEAVKPIIKRKKKEVERSDA